MRRKPKPVTPGSLERAALFYLQRFATSSENLRRVLVRKAKRVSRLTGADAVAAEAMVGPVIAQLINRGLLNDSAYARQKAASLAGRGMPIHRVRAELRRRGLAGNDIDAATEPLGEAGLHGDRHAAILFAKRRRIGPFRLGAIDERTRARELAAFARAGFRYAIARTIVDSVSADALIAAAAEHHD